MAWATSPPVVGKVTGSGRENQVGSRPRSRGARRVRTPDGSTATTAGSVVHPAATAMIPSPWAASDPSEVAGPSPDGTDTSSTVPSGLRTARRSTPPSLRTNHRSPPTKAYRDRPNTHWGVATSASPPVRASRSPVSGSTRCTCHQSPRSVTTCNIPSDRHSGWKNDSPPAATHRALDKVHPSVSATRSATHSSVSSHGRLGWFHRTQARRVPSGETRGQATKSAPVASTSTRIDPSVATATNSLAGSPPAWSTGWASRTHTYQQPSGVVRPSA